MVKQEKTSVISDKTKIVLAIPQAVAVIVFILSVSGGFVGVGSEASEANKRSQKNETRITTLEEKQQREREDFLKLLQEVRESQIRIEGKIDLKQDRFK